jgi:cyclophilin family peptidyl-prolyl cis-trans isomerase
MISYSRSLCAVSASLRQFYRNPGNDWRVRSIIVRTFIIALGTFVVCASTNLYPMRASADQYVRLDYNLTLNPRARNTAFLQLFDDRPQTTANFLQYVNNTVANGSFNGTIMHRLSPNFVIQGGGYYPSLVFQPSLNDYSLNPAASVDKDGNYSTANPTVIGESGNSPSRSNVIGTVAMALSTGPNSGTSQWFVNLANNTFLDGTSNGGPFTVFGNVAGDGMTLFNAFNTLSIQDMNPDFDGNGSRDGGPFGSYDLSGHLISGVPYLSGPSGNFLVVLQKASQIDYLGNGLSTDVPAGGLTFSARDAYIDTGTAFTGGGALTIGAGRTLGIREQYSLNRSLLNHGTLAPGLQLGAVTIQSTYFQFSDGTLSIDLAGTTADTLYDQLNATSTAFLAGKLQVGTISGFTPALGNSFTVLNASSIIGSFATYDLPQLASGQAWKINQSGTSISLTVVEGDYNRNGVVDSGDYDVWRKQRGATGLTAYSGADGNGDGIVNDADLAVWRSNFGAIGGGVHGAGSGSLVNSTLPEPSAIVLALGGLLVGGMRFRRPIAANVSRAGLH